MIECRRLTSVAGLNDRVVTVGLTLFLALLDSGCRVVQSTAELPGKAVSTLTHGKMDRQSVDGVELQQQLKRFADERFDGLPGLRPAANPPWNPGIHALESTLDGDVLSNDISRLFLTS